MRFPGMSHRSIRTRRDVFVAVLYEAHGQQMGVELAGAL
jgi:hypothetical protein